METSANTEGHTLGTGMGEGRASEGELAAGVNMDYGFDAILASSNYGCQLRGALKSHKSSDSVSMTNGTYATGSQKIKWKTTNAMASSLRPEALALLEKINASYMTKTATDSQSKNWVDLCDEWTERYGTAMVSKVNLLQYGIGTWTMKSSTSGAGIAGGVGFQNSSSFTCPKPPVTTEGGIALEVSGSLTDAVSKGTAAVTATTFPVDCRYEKFTMDWVGAVNGLTLQKLTDGIRPSMGEYKPVLPPPPPRVPTCAKGSVELDKPKMTPAEVKEVMDNRAEALKEAKIAANENKLRDKSQRKRLKKEAAAEKLQQKKEAHNAKIEAAELKRNKKKVEFDIPDDPEAIEEESKNENLHKNSSGGSRYGGRSNRVRPRLKSADELNLLLCSGADASQILNELYSNWNDWSDVTLTGVEQPRPFDTYDETLSDEENLSMMENGSARRDNDLFLPVLGGGSADHWLDFGKEWGVGSFEVVPWGDVFPGLRGYIPKDLPNSQAIQIYKAINDYMQLADYVRYINVKWQGTLSGLTNGELTLLHKEIINGLSLAMLKCGDILNGLKYMPPTNDLTVMDKVHGDVEQYIAKSRKLTKATKEWAVVLWTKTHVIPLFSMGGYILAKKTEGGGGLWRTFQGWRCAVRNSWGGLKVTDENVVPAQDCTAVMGRHVFPIMAVNDSKAVWFLASFGNSVFGLSESHDGEQEGGDEHSAKRMGWLTSDFFDSQSRAFQLGRASWTLSVTDNSDLMKMTNKSKENFGYTWNDHTNCIYWNDGYPKNFEFYFLPVDSPDGDGAFGTPAVQKTNIKLFEKMNDQMLKGIDTSAFDW